MEKELIQKNRFSHRKFILSDDKIYVEYKSPKDTSKYELSLDQLGFTKHYHAAVSISEKVAIIFFLLAPFVVLGLQYSQNKIDVNKLISLTLLSFVAAAIAFFKEKKDDIYLKGGKHNLVFYRNRPNETEVLEFIDLVIATTKKHLKSRYVYFDSYTDEEYYLNGVLYLRNLKIISNREVHELLSAFKTSRLL